MKRDTDASILERLLAIHHAPNTLVVDLSGGLRRLWTNALLERYRPLFLDNDLSKRPDIIGDWNEQHLDFARGSVGTEVWDPPMMSDDRGRLGYAQKYGTGTAKLKGARAVIQQFGPLLDSSSYALIPGRGTLICKMADQVHDEALQWQPYELWKIATERGWYACDRKERARAQPPHNTTITQRHIRRGTTHWLVFHNFEGCAGSGIAVQRRCLGCGELFPVTRRDRQTCGDTCRQRVSRFERELPPSKRDRNARTH